MCVFERVVRECCLLNALIGWFPVNVHLWLVRCGWPSPTHCNSLCFSRLHLIKITRRRNPKQSRNLQMRTQLGSSWSSFSNKLTKVDKKSFSSCSEERKREERVWNAADHHQIHFLHHKLEIRSDNMAYHSKMRTPQRQTETKRIIKVWKNNEQTILKSQKVANDQRGCN